MSGNIWIYIFVSFAVSYVIRVLPLTVFRKPIKNRFIRSFLFYVPYVALAVMTFPAIIEATQNVWAGVAALAVGVILSLMECQLLPVAACCCATVFVLELLMT